MEIAVELRKAAPRGSSLFITGNLPELGDWQPGIIPLEKVGPKRFRFILSVASGTVIECKITRGSWKNQAVYDDSDGGFPPENRLFQAGSVGRCTISIVDWMDTIPRDADEIVGDIETIPDIAGEGLRYNRDVQILLPPSYETSPSRRYQVLYMHDGQNLFDPATSFAGADWKVDETVSRLIMDGKIPEIIVVGIANTPDRMEEYNLYTPRGKAYARFIVEKLKPMIDARYRTLSGREQTAIMGSSMGGLFSFQLAWAYPEVFTMAGCLSSAFWPSKSRIYRAVSEDLRPLKGIRIYLDCGGKEPSFVQSLRKMTELLYKLGYREGLDVHSFLDPEANHSEPAWARRLEIPLTFLFGSKARNKEGQEDGKQDGKMGGKKKSRR
ncbi:MAG: hypothetical protein HQM09_22325 [Candidatus Riflebacteria bacterium]|nr:hypothetical protein [Candidatus Riflebacteria bacterium]